MGSNQPRQRTPLRSAASLGLSVHKAIYPSARRTKCLNLGQAVSVVTKTCRPNPPKLASVRSSVPSARHAPTLFSAASAQTAEVSWSSALGVRLTSLPIIHPQASASTIPLVARRPHSAVNAPRALSVLIVIAHPNGTASTTVSVGLHYESVEGPTLRSSRPARKAAQVCSPQT